MLFIHVDPHFFTFFPFQRLLPPPPPPCPIKGSSCEPDPYLSIQLRRDGLCLFFLFWLAGLGGGFFFVFFGGGVSFFGVFLFFFPPFKWSLFRAFLPLSFFFLPGLDRWISPPSPQYAVPPPHFLFILIPPSLCLRLIPPFDTSRRVHCLHALSSCHLAILLFSSCWSHVGG